MRIYWVSFENKLLRMSKQRYRSGIVSHICCKSNISCDLTKSHIIKNASLGWPKTFSQLPWFCSAHTHTHIYVLWVNSYIIFFMPGWYVVRGSPASQLNEGHHYIVEGTLKLPSILIKAWYYTATFRSHWNVWFNLYLLFRLAMQKSSSCTVKNFVNLFQSEFHDRKKRTEIKMMERLCNSSHQHKPNCKICFNLFILRKSWLNNTNYGHWIVWDEAIQLLYNSKFHKIFT